MKRIFRSGVILLLVFVFLVGIFAREAGAMTTEEEKKLGQKVLLEMSREVEFVRDLTLQAFVDRVGYALVAQVPSTPFEYKFYIVNSPEANAFAIPGGAIFVTTGLLVMADDEPEVAGVLSHEISHVQGRHVSQMIERSKKLSLATLAAILAGALLGGGGKTSEAAAMTAMAAQGALTLKYSREMETDADQNSLQYLIKAGYDPKGIIIFLNRINKISMNSTSKVPAYLLSHPVTENRISLLENLLQSGQTPLSPDRAVGGYKKIQARAFVAEREPHVAVSHFQSMTNAHPEDTDGYYGLGLAYRRMGRLDKSMETFEKAHDLAPEDRDILAEVGEAYFLTGKLDEAAEHLEAAQSIQARTGGTNDLSTLYYLGRTYQEEGEFAKALPLLLKVQERVPEFIDVQHNLGSLYGRMGKKGLSHFYFGKYFKLRGEVPNAVLHFRQALGYLEPGSPEREEVQREIRTLTQAR